MENKQEQFKVSTNREDIDFTKLHSFLTTRSYWSQGISKDTLRSGIDNSLTFSVINQENREFVGFARVITDCATFGYLADVYIEEDYRGMGLGKLLIEYIMNFPDLQGLRSWFLYTKDAHGLYKQFGWMELSDELKLRAMIYKKT